MALTTSTGTTLVTTGSGAGRPKQDIDYHLKEWTSGEQGGGRVPADFGWGTNPKQRQEEHGAGTLEQPAERLREQANRSTGV